MKKLILLGLFVALMLPGMSQKTPKPPMMGMSTWNNYHVKINDSIIRALADAMVSKGMLAAGYNYMNIDDGFFNGRDAQGNMLINETKFPNGMKAIADYIHSKGLKAGMYGDAGANTCASMWETPPETGGIGAGFYNHEAKDMELYFKTWGYDYVKVDYCGGTQAPYKLDEETQYKKIKAAIDATGITDYAFNVCRWEFPGSWVIKMADSWRISYDIDPTYSRMLYILDLNTFLAPYMSAGHYNDMDMLEVGNGSLTVNENKAQMSLWCVLTSPLVIGCDLGKASQTTLDILKNNEVIAVNQDMTEQGHLISDFGNSLQVWSKKLNGKLSGDRAVVLFNRGNASAKITVNFKDIDLGSSATIRDLWAKSDLGNFTDSYSATVPAHGVVMVKISGTNVNPKVYEAEYAYMHNFNHLVNTVAIPNQARATTMTDASKNAIASYIGNNADNYIEFREVYVDEAGKYPLTISYLCGDDRTARLTVNGVEVATETFNSGGYSLVGSQSVLVQLNAGNNTIRIENQTGFAPDLDKITLGDKDAPLPGNINLEAEDATLSVGLSITSNTDASGGKLVAGMGSIANATISFPTFENSNSAGVYPLTLRYTSDSKDKLSLLVNDKTYNLNNLKSPAGEIGYITLLVNIRKGSNSIVLQNATGTISIDNIALNLTRNHAYTLNLEAENATLIKNASNEPRVVDKAAASGGKVVGWLGNSDIYKMVFSNVAVKKAGNYKVNLLYFTGEARNLTIKINGTSFPQTSLNSGGWDTQGTATIASAAFNETGNTIEVYNATGWAPDIDKLELDGTALVDGEIIASNTNTGTGNIFSNSFALYPNPSNGKFTIETENEQHIKILNLMCAEIQSFSLVKGKNEFSLTTLPKGVYMLQAGNFSQKLIIK